MLRRSCLANGELVPEGLTGWPLPRGIFLFVHQHLRAETQGESKEFRPLSVPPWAGPRPGSAPTWLTAYLMGPVISRERGPGVW